MYGGLSELAPLDKDAVHGCQDADVDHGKNQSHEEQEQKQTQNRNEQEDRENKLGAKLKYDRYDHQGYD